jgi:hypothetical protein
MSRADVPMPHTVGNACIEITEHTYPYKYYEAKLWCFNRGTYMDKGKSIDEAKSNGLQICDGRAFQHKCSFGELNFL